MENYRIIAQWDRGKFEELFYNIRKAIHEIHKQKLSDSGIRVNIPVYVIQLIQKHHEIYMANPLDYEEGKTEIFGCPVYPSYENFVVVFHIDMPIYGNTAYQVIDLK